APTVRIHASEIVIFSPRSWVFDRAKSAELRWPATKSYSSPPARLELLFLPHSNLFLALREAFEPFVQFIPEAPTTVPSNTFNPTTVFPSLPLFAALTKFD